MKNILVAVFLAMGILLLVSFSSWAMIASNVAHVGFLQKETETFHLYLGASLNVEYGDMTYTIQGPEDGGWKSVLKWPLDNIVYLGGIGSFSFSRKFQVNVGLWKSVTEEAGTMKDSDWLYGYYGNRKAVYSETDATVDSTQFDVNFRYDFFQRESFSLGAILGYAYTRWDWAAGDGYQWTIDPNNFYQGPIQGIGITYVQKVKVPYLGVALSLSSSDSAFGFNVYTLYSPIAKCDDEDDHILRSKLSQGQTDGKFLSIGGDVRWSFTYHWSLTGTLNYSGYDLTGNQTQYFYAGDNAGSGASNIDMTVEGSQVYFGLRVGYEL